MSHVFRTDISNFIMMKKNNKNNAIFITMLFLSPLFAQEWELTLTAQDINSQGSSDYIRIGYCNECHDGFHFGEDEYDLPNGGNAYTDIQLFNYSWLGTQDENNVICNNPNFYIDKRSLHGPEFLSEWLISGNTYSIDENAQIQLSWDIDNLFDEIDIFLYIGNTGINMKNQSTIIINSSDLHTEFDFNTMNELVNIKILVGSCAEQGTTAYYLDNDDDGLGSGEPTFYCEGYQPNNWVSNNLDLNDYISCTSNNIDRCNICNGNNECVDCNDVEWGTAFLDSCDVCSNGNTGHIPNSDIDCNGDCFGTALLDNCNICSGGYTDHTANNNQDCTGLCFGTAIIDDCGNCNGFNESCIDDIFNLGPQNLNAYINDNVIDLSWDQLNYPENETILGFNIYIQNESYEYIINTTDEYYTLNEYNEGIFCVSAFDQFNNESLYSCIEASEMITVSLTLYDGPNLISFPALPLDVNIENIFSSIEENIHGVLTEGQSAARVGEYWVGSLTEIIPTRGYWLILDLEDSLADINYQIQGFPIDQNVEYQIWEGANLISFLGDYNVPIDIALSDEIEIYISDIIGEGNAAYNHPVAGWLGSLTTFNSGKGYWIKATQNLNLVWSTDSFVSTPNHSINLQKKYGQFDYLQSSEQAFYYVKTVKNLNLNNDDKIISYCNGKIAGSQNWNGDYTDVPVMGFDGSSYTLGYCETGDIPEFKFFDFSKNIYLNLESNEILPWKSNQITFISLSPISDIKLISNTKINTVYPNPFNPSTTIEFSIYENSEIEILIYDLNGLKVQTLFEGYQNKGSHKIIWDGKNFPSGMYFFRLNTPNETLTQKLFLLK